MTGIPPTPTQPRLNFNLSMRIWMLFLFIFLPVLIASDYFFYEYATRTALGILTTDLSRTMQGALRDVDAENLKMLVQEESKNNPNCPPSPTSSTNGYYPDDNPHYRAHMEWIRNILIYHPEMSIYTYVKGSSEGDVLAIGSSWYFREPRQGFKFCELYNSHGLSHIAEGLEHRVDVWEIYTDSYGSWITTYAPIKDKDGTIIGAIGMDLPANEVTDIQHRFQVIFWTILIVAFLLMFYISYSINSTVTGPVIKLSKLAQEIGSEKTDIDFSNLKNKNASYDEIDLLAGSMKRMNQRLNQQRRELLQSQEKMQELARATLQSQETERRYYSRELHDRAGQLLTNLKMKVQNILVNLPSDGATLPLNNFDHKPMKDDLVQVMDETDKTLEILREMSHQMRPSLLDVGDINLAFENHCIEYSKLTGLNATYNAGEPISPPEEVAIGLFRFLQEALINVHKHAKGATAVNVNLSEEDGVIKMSVQDNGKEQMPSIDQSGIGLMGIRERFVLLNGHVSVTRPQGGGFRIEVTVPNTPVKPM